MKKTLALLLLLAGLTMEVRAETLTWNGTEGHMTWNTEDMNWLQGSNAAKYTDGDTVEFCDTGSGIVTLARELAPASVTVNSGNDYTFAGNGSLTGEMQLTKEGAGTLHISTSNFFWGGSTVIKGGTLVMGNANALGTSSITLNGGTLNLGGAYAIDSNKLNLQGSATIGNGAILGDLNVAKNTQMTLLAHTTIKGGITLNGGMLDLGQNTISSSVNLQGSASIGNGTIGGAIGCDLVVAHDMRLSFLENAYITSSVILGDNATLDLGQNTISSSVTLQGSASIGNGTINSNLAVQTDNNLTLLANTTITGSITLGSNAMLDLGQNTISSSVILQGHASIGNGALNGDLAVAEGGSLALLQNTAITGGITLGDDAGLDLGQNTLSGSVTLQGSAAIGNGALNSDLAVAAGKELWLYSGELTGSGTINLGNGATLLVGNGGYNMGCGISGCGAIVMDEAKVTTSLTGSMKDFTGSLEVQGGTLNLMNIAEAAKLNVANVSIAANGVLGVYKSETAAEANEGVLTITGGHKLTAGKDARLNADLVMGGRSTLDVSAAEGNGGLEMGSTVTLNPGNVLLSDADMDAIGELGFMGKYDLFNGVDRLSLGGDFLSELGLADKWVNAGEVFANDLFKSAEREYYLFYSGVNRGGAGGNVGTVYLMQIPEPTTGTLSLLALCALAARRRRK